MVENSLGRLWVEGHPNDSLKANWKYYLEEAEQEPEVQAQLQVIRNEYTQMKPEDILCIDPCSGSGHILVYLFDVLVQIYEAYGYPTRDAVASIIQNNLWGLDIDDRAAQLAYFAVMMKARQYDKGWFRRGIEPHVFALQDSGDWSTFERQMRQAFSNHPSLYEDAAIKVAKALFDSFADAKEYGSIIQPDVTLDDLAMLEKVLDEMHQHADLMDFVVQADAASLMTTLKPMILQCRALAQKYHVVVTNPPYMSVAGMDDKLIRFVKEYYPDTKSDMSTVFMEQCLALCNSSGFMSMINIPVWMFISSYEKMRSRIINENSVVDMIHPGRGIFGSDFGSTTFVISKRHISQYRAIYYRLFDVQGDVESSETREQQFLSKKGRFISTQERYMNIPGLPFAYWISDRLIDAFTGKTINDFGFAGIGMRTGDNNRFLRFWYEVAITNVLIGCKSREEQVESQRRWIPYNKGGEYRKWYGNNEYVVNWFNDGFEIKENTKKVYPYLGDDLGWKISNESYYYKPGITWSGVTISKNSFRSYEEGFIFDSGANGYFPYDASMQSVLLAYLNNCIAQYVLSVINPTINTGAGTVKRVPIILPNEESDLARIDDLAKECIEQSQSDWDSFETSWDFQIHPLVRWIRDRHNAQTILPLFDQYNKWKQANPEKANAQEDNLAIEASSTAELSFNLWRLEAYMRFQRLKANEEELNRIFIDIYGLQDELTPEVADKDVTVRQADLGRDIRSLVSYAVGCMLGRYSLDKPGLVFAGGEWDAAQYVTYLADKDGVLPITDDDYFSDDVVSMFVDWVKTVFGTNELEDNLKFIATALYPNGGGTARELIRQYFLNDFYKDHLKIYQKRPIYWLFDAGKKNSFKCLIYLHRYQPDTVARVRTDYVHEMQARYRTAMEDLTHRVETTSGSERVRLQKQLVKIQGQEEELRKYEEKIHHYADMMLPLDLDDGVKVNYAKLADVLAPIK